MTSMTRSSSFSGAMRPMATNSGTRASHPSDEATILTGG